MQDIDGNILEEDDVVYIVDAAIMGSKSKRLLCCRLEEIISDNKGKFLCFENQRIYIKTSSTVIKPHRD